MAYCILNVLWVGLLAVCDMVQTDSVLLRINGEPVTVAQYAAYCAAPERSTSTGKELLEQFVRHQLMVAEAQKARLDTTATFAEAWGSWCRDKLHRRLSDSAALDKEARARYDCLYGDGARREVRQIFRPLRQQALDSEVRREERLMDSIYAQLKTDSMQFVRLQRRFSADTLSHWIARRRTTEEFERQVFNLPPHAISAPFYTPQGIHIVQWVDVQEPPAYEAVKTELIAQQAALSLCNKVSDRSLDRWKQELAYTPDEARIRLLLAGKEVQGTLFTLQGRNYTDTQYRLFSQAHPWGHKRCFEAFVRKSVLDEAARTLEKAHARGGSWQLHHDSLLVSLLLEREVEPKTTQPAMLETYFRHHQSDYEWPSPRFKGMVLHCPAKRMARKVQKFLRKLPETERMEAIRLTFNQGDTLQVVAEEGLFALGDNPFVDALCFKQGTATPLASHPYTVWVGERKKGPDSYCEVEEAVRAALRRELERQYADRLRASAKVEINQEVLKSVNNH